MTEINRGNAQAAAPAFPILGVLGIAFVVLKLCGVIGWSWWWVTVPFWGPFALILGVLLIAAFVIALIALGKAIADRSKAKQGAKR